jgi:hypothetical protein
LLHCRQKKGGTLSDAAHFLETDQGPHQLKYYFSLLFTVLKVFERLPPRADIAAIAATAIKAAIRPYSIAVAPSSFLKSFLIIFISSLLFNIHPVSQKLRLILDFIDRILRNSYFPAFKTLLETLFHIPVEVDATVPRAAIIAMTINDAISPYSIAVAPFWHLTMPRISSNILAPISLAVASEF